MNKLKIKLYITWFSYRVSNAPPRPPLFVQLRPSLRPVDRQTTGYRWPVVPSPSTGSPVGRSIPELPFLSVEPAGRSWIFLLEIKI